MHQQNGSVERKHRHIVETSLTLLATASVPFSYWDDAFLTTTYLINCLPSPVTFKKSPIEILYHKPPNYNFLKTFGCTSPTYVHTTTTNLISTPNFVFFLETVLIIRATFPFQKEK